VFSGNLAKGDSKFAIFALADDGDIANDGEAPSLALTPKHDQNHLHLSASTISFELEPLGNSSELPRTPIT
jgi:hypothetical protein